MAYIEETKVFYSHAQNLGLTSGMSQYAQEFSILGQRFIGQ